MDEKSRNKMIWFAWGMEILAATVGLTIGASNVLANTKIGFNSTVMMATASASLPMVMIAASELCKIPMVRAVMNAKRWWGSLLALILLFGACLLTFETVFNGLERQWALTSHKIDLAKVEIANIREKITEKGNAVDDVNEPRLAQISELKHEREAAQERIRELDGKLAQEIEGHNTRYQTCVANKRPGCISGGKFVAGYKADHAEAIKPHLARIENLNRDIDRLTSEGKAIAKADETAEEKARLRDAEADAKAKLNALILDSQIHRLAAKFFGKDDPKEVSQEQVTFIALVWFASVAAFVSLMGPGLAFNYEITGEGWGRATKSSDVRNVTLIDRARNKYYRARRKYLARRRNKLVRTEIKVEDRIIYKYIAVPEDYTAEQIKAEVVKLHAVA